jgi:hypothetical protein
MNVSDASSAISDVMVEEVIHLPTLMNGAKSTGLLFLYGSCALRSETSMGSREPRTTTKIPQDAAL